MTPMRSIQTSVSAAPRAVSSWRLSSRNATAKPEKAALHALPFQHGTSSADRTKNSKICASLRVTWWEGACRPNSPKTGSMICVRNQPLSSAERSCGRTDCVKMNAITANVRISKTTRFAGMRTGFISLRRPSALRLARPFVRAP